jgi:hypothetical protein
MTSRARRRLPSRACGPSSTWKRPDDAAGELADALAAALVADEGWYADFEVADDHVVVFAGRAFRYAKGDRAGREAAVEYGRTHGVPEHQLDWGD